MKNLTAKTAAALLGMWVSTTMISSAYALQAVEGGAKEAGKPWLQWGVTIGMAGLCVLVVFKNAKRGHQD